MTLLYIDQRERLKGGTRWKFTVLRREKSLLLMSTDQTHAGTSRSIRSALSLAPSFYLLVASRHSDCRSFGQI